MARDTGTDATTALDGYKLLRLAGTTPRPQMYVMYRGFAYKMEKIESEKPKWTDSDTSWEGEVEDEPEKIESEKSDVQPMVVDENEFGNVQNFQTGKSGILTFRNQEEYDKYVNWNNDHMVREFDTGAKEFDKGIEGLTDRRGDVYGHPKDDFHRIIQMQKALVDCDDEFARHIMNMICVKMSRLVKTPDHSDSWLDIVGYVRTWFMIKEKKDG